VAPFVIIMFWKGMTGATWAEGAGEMRPDCEYPCGNSNGPRSLPMWKCLSPVKTGPALADWPNDSGRPVVTPPEKGWSYSDPTPFKIGRSKIKRRFSASLAPAWA
jgi:hypothetical protein